MHPITILQLWVLIATLFLLRIAHSVYENGNTLVSLIIVVLSLVLLNIVLAPNRLVYKKN